MLLARKYDLLLMTYKYDYSPVKTTTQYNCLRPPEYLDLFLSSSFFHATVCLVCVDAFLASAARLPLGNMLSAVRKKQKHQAYF